MVSEIIRLSGEFHLCKVPEKEQSLIHLEYSSSKPDRESECSVRCFFERLYK